MDIGTGLTVLGSAIGGAKLVEKILGPTADYVGVGLKNWAENRVRNTARIFQKAAEKLGAKINDPGAVPPKVLKEILEEGSYCDDELTAEYFGGVLASSRSGVTRDDRAASYLKLIAELSTYQIRFHFIAYSLFREQFAGSGLRPTFNEDLQKMWVFIPYSALVPAMDFVENEDALAILLHCLSGFGRHSLLETSHWGSREHVSSVNKQRGWPEVEGAGLCVCPTQYGIDLWLWAIGAGTISRTVFLDRAFDLPKLPKLPLPSNVVKLAQPQR